MLTPRRGLAVQVLLSALLIQVTAPEILSVGNLKYRDCSDVLEDERSDHVTDHVTAAPVNVTVYQEPDDRHFNVTWSRPASPGGENQKYYYLLVSPVGDADEKSKVCYAIANNRTDFSFPSTLAGGADVRDRLHTSNSTIRVTVSSTLTFLPGSYTTFLVRIAYPDGFNDINNWSTPTTVRLLRNCTLEIGFIEAPDKFQVTLYRASISSRHSRPWITNVSKSPALLQAPGPGKYTIMLEPREKRGGGCLCALTGCATCCNACISLLLDPVILLADNSSGSECVALPTPVPPPRPPVVKPRARPSRPPVEATPPSGAVGVVVGVVTGGLTVTVIIIVFVLIVLHKSGKRYITALLGDPGLVDVILLSSSRDRPLAVLIADWLAHSRRHKLRTKIVCLESRRCFSASDSELCYNVDHAVYIFLLDSLELREEMSAENRHYPLFKQQVRDKFRELRKRNNNQVSTGGRQVSPRVLEQMVVLTLDTFLPWSEFPLIVPYQLPSDVTDVRRLVRSDVIDQARLAKMRAVIFDVAEERDASRDEKLRPHSQEDFPRLTNDTDKPYLHNTTHPSALNGYCDYQPKGNEIPNGCAPQALEMNITEEEESPRVLSDEDLMIRSCESETLLVDEASIV